MKIVIESTSQIVTVNAIQCRVWEGRTEMGVMIQALIPRIAARKGEDLSQFEAELQEQRPPSPDFEAFPLRMIL